MLDTLQEIQNNGVVNRFKEIAESYGLYGVYVNWIPGGLNEDCVYFVCGLDKNKVLNENIDMFQIIENQNRSKGYVPIDAAAFPLTGKHPFMTHYNIIEYCHKLDAVQKVYKHFNKRIPSKLPASLIKTMGMTWENFTNRNKAPALRKEYEKVLEYAIKTEEESFNKNNPNYKKEQYILNGYYDTGKNKLQNWFKMHFSKHKNQVTTSHLLTQPGRINRAEILFKDYKAMKKALDARPDILYSFSSVHGGILKVADSEGYGSKEKNDKRTYTLYYSSVNAKDIEEMIQKINHPVEFDRKLTEIDPSGSGTEHIVIPIDYYDMFKQNCDANGVKFCIDRSFHSTIGNGIAVIFSADDSKKAYEFLTGILKASERFKLKEALPSNTLNGYQHKQIERGTSAKEVNSMCPKNDYDDICK